MTIGILAFQGGVSEHRDALRRLGVESRYVRSVSDLDSVDALIIPGGESTVIKKFLEQTGVGKKITECARRGMPMYGTCAGVVILADSISSAEATRVAPQHGLKLIDINVDRNAYGSQSESFEAPIELNGSEVTGIFIRAPRITRVDPAVEVLAMFNSDPVVCKQGNILVSTFHPELTNEPSLLHELFLTLFHVPA